MINSNFLKTTSVRWVVALKEEAEIILDNYKMVLVNEKTLYPIYKNKFPIKRVKQSKVILI